MRGVRRWAVTVIAVLLTALLTAMVGGCADAPAVPSPPPGATPVVDGTPDTEYARAMVGHHEQALVLAALVPGRSSSPGVADLAFRIDRAQVEEVGQLQGFLRLRGVPPGPARKSGPALGGHLGGIDGMAGMADPATIDRLRGLSGPAFDRLWAQTMIAHHEGALTMARGYLAATGGAGSTAPLAESARTLLVTQQAEIDRMRTLLARG